MSFALSINEAAETQLSLTSPRICVAILLGAPLNAQNFERIGIPYLSLYVNIVVLDCKPWLGRSDAGLHHAHAKWDPVEKIVSERDLELALRRHRPDYALDFVGLGALTPKLQKLLAGAGTRYVVQKSGSLPVPSLWSRLTWKLRSSATSKTATTAEVAPSGNSAIAGGSLPHLLDKVRARWLLRRSLRAPDLALLAGGASFNHFTRRARHILWVGSQDYHIYHRLPPRAQEGLPGGRYAVFIDDNLPYASDWSVLGIEPPVTPEIYYLAMRRLLDIAEATWQMPVVVAGHPSSQFDDRVLEGFGARQLRYGQTAELVRDASLVLLHGSTAVSFAVLGEKPLLFLTTRQLCLAQYGLHVQTLARRLGQEPLNIDRCLSLPPLASLAVRGDYYRRYTEDFLRASQSRESSPWQAFISHVCLHNPKCPAAAPGGKIT